MKSRTNTATREMTTALVVDSPTPLAPPDVVNPHAQLICRHTEKCGAMVGHVTGGAGMATAAQCNLAARHAADMQTQAPRPIAQAQSGMPAPLR